MLELVVDPDLEFDDSVAQDSQSDELQSGTPEPLSHQEQKKPHAKQRLGALPHTKHTPNFQQDGFDKQPKSLQQLPFQTSTYINSKSQDQSSVSIFLIVREID